MSRTDDHWIDIKRERRDLYAPAADRIALIEVPRLPYLMVDGQGDPNTSVAYRNAIRSLYPLSYAVRSLGKENREQAHVVGPLEALWSAENMSVFHTREKSAWDWTVMITQPGWVTAETVEAARARVAAKDPPPALEQVRWAEHDDSLAVQALHVGPYDDEGPLIARMHEEFMPAHRLRPSGRHHEIYLSDPRRVAPDRLRTILRQPVVRT